MGLIRLLLAVSVLISHTGLNPPVSGRVAVQCFYMISGFLMAHVVTGRGDFQTARDFYINRCLRLWPQYAVVVILTAIITGSSLGNGSTEVLAQVTLIGQDWVTIADTINGKESVFLLPQAWTISVELTFYAVAPYLLSRPRLIWGTLIASIGLRLLMIRAGFDQDPWSYRFFPTELAFFCIGALSYRVLLPIYTLVQRRTLDCVSLAICAAAVTTYSVTPGAQLLKDLALFSLIAISLPALFRLQGTWALDGSLGELSYPLYLCHVLVIALLRAADLRGWALAVAAVVASIMVAGILARYIGAPIDIWRRRTRHSRSQAEINPRATSASRIAVGSAATPVGFTTGAAPKNANLLA